MYLTLTPLRILALRFARGDHDTFPSYAVARPLEAAGWIVWTGARPHAPPGERGREPPPRGWTLTAEGRAVLDEFERAQPR